MGVLVFCERGAAPSTYQDQAERGVVKSYRSEIAILKFIWRSNTWVC
jgi:hypothetical protein